IETHNISEVIIRQKMIIQSYRNDISKYAGKKKGLAKAVFDSIPMQLAEKNKKFVLADVAKGAKNRKYEDAILWLYDAGIANYCFNISALQIPFELNEKRNIYKFFMRDTGLLSCMSLGNVQNAILNGDININEGAITENAVADLVFKNGHRLHYYDIKGRLEIDFILNIDNSVIPVEVKSGPDYKRHSSLSKVLNNSNLNIKSAVVLCMDNIQIEKNITYYPLYMAMFL
ncbi:MAG: ATPase, partial [Spirochaetes bacterium]